MQNMHPYLYNMTSHMIMCYNLQIAVALTLTYCHVGVCVLVMLKAFWKAASQILFNVSHLCTPCLFCIGFSQRKPACIYSGCVLSPVTGPLGEFVHWQMQHSLTLCFHLLHTYTHRRCPGHTNTHMHEYRMHIDFNIQGAGC